MTDNTSEHRSPTRWAPIALILLLAGVLRFYRLAQEGFGNQYYAAAVQSMLTGWRNFYFVSFDAAGFVSVDKPPLGLWVQAGSAALLGFHGWALILPQALAGVLSVGVLYRLVRSAFGVPAGLIAALALALTPVSVAADRNNTMDSLLVLALLLAAWAVTRATREGRLRWLLLGAALVGIGFNIKMLQAYMALPALWLLYLLAAPVSWLKRLWHLGVASLALAVISLAWAVSVDLTPPENRPYVGSSQSNSVMELILGHNGMARLLPGGLRRMVSLDRAANQQGGTSAPAALGPRQAAPQGPTAPQGPGGNQGPTSEIGEAGVLRLFNPLLGGQASWLLPLAGLGLAAAIWLPAASPADKKRAYSALLLWTAWLLPQMVFFSAAGLFHRYYLSMLAPAIAALAGAGMTALWSLYRQPGRLIWLLPLTLVVSAVVQASLLKPFPAYARWLTPLILLLACGSALGLVVMRLRAGAHPGRLPMLLAGLGLLALLIAPSVWALTPVIFGGDVALPHAGPDLEQAASAGLRAAPSAAPLTRYLQAHRSDERFMVAMLRASEAASLILDSGQAVMALGGFTGSDPILTPSKLVAKINAGEVRYFILSGDAPAQAELIRWVTGNCHPIPAQEWMKPGSAAGGSIQPVSLRSQTMAPPNIYDCKK